ncbi:MAG: tail fiber domain-containing protein, partial [Bacteroidales bacterium]|nr:tail fiber domain-containing protein [Bacteroidales bacterium]
LASGPMSLAWRQNTVASGNYSLALGLFTRAEAFNSTALGRYNIGGGTPSVWVATDPLFEIGNGPSGANRNNALTILKNGRIGIGIHYPAHHLTIPVTTKPTNVVANGEGIGIVNIGTGTFWNIHMSASWLRFSYNGKLAGSRINDLGEYVQNSDQRFKTNIAMYSNVLGRIKDLRVMEYNYLNQSSSKKSIGLMAQDVLPLFPELVASDDNEDYLGINYAGFGVIAIKAIQEQQVIIENQEIEIRELKNRLDTLEELIKSKN